MPKISGSLILTLLDENKSLTAISVPARKQILWTMPKCKCPFSDCTYEIEGIVGDLIACIDFSLFGCHCTKLCFNSKTWKGCSWNWVISVKPTPNGRHVFFTSPSTQISKTAWGPLPLRFSKLKNCPQPPICIVWFQKYPYLSHTRLFDLRPPPPRIFRSKGVFVNPPLPLGISGIFKWGLLHVKVVLVL